MTPVPGHSHMYNQLTCRRLEPSGDNGGGMNISSDSSELVDRRVFMCEKWWQRSLNQGENPSQALLKEGGWTVGTEGTKIVFSLLMITPNPPWTRGGRIRRSEPVEQQFIWVFSADPSPLSTRSQKVKCSAKKMRLKQTFFSPEHQKVWEPSSLFWFFSSFCPWWQDRTLV